MSSRNRLLGTRFAALLELFYVNWLRDPHGYAVRVARAIAKRQFLTVEAWRMAWLPLTPFDPSFEETNGESTLNLSVLACESRLVKDTANRKFAESLGIQTSR